MKQYLLYLCIVFSILLTLGNLINQTYRIIYYIVFLVYCQKTNELYRHLMSNYNKNVRPVRNNSDLVNVKIGLKLIQIADVVCIQTII